MALVDVRFDLALPHAFITPQSYPQLTVSAHM
jgi:hypothetical protein